MSVIDQIIGRVNEEEVVPVMGARPHEPRRQSKDKDKSSQRLRRASVVASILGITENDNESIFPDSAKPIDPDQAMDVLGLEPVRMPTDKPEEPAKTNADGEELIPPSAALVAPDVTPQALIPLDPSLVPAGENVAPPPTWGRPSAPPVMPGSQETGAMDAILGRQNPAPRPMASEPVNNPPVTAEGFVHTLNKGNAKARAKQAIQEAVTPGIGMPDHSEGDGTAILSAFRRFAR